ncbi:MAG: hypothetical protein AB8B47_07920 [Roseobacter sp.]
MSQFDQMRLIAVTFLWMVCAGAAYGQSCPQFYRFVDFGLQGRNGDIHRGGPLFRAESFEGRSLLLTEQTRCLVVRDIAKDGHGNPIPVVSEVQYDPEKADLALTKLRVFTTPSAADTAARIEQTHLTVLDSVQATVLRGATYVCVQQASSDRISCQVVNPYQQDIALVVFCAQNTCEMPLMAFDAQIAVTAEWSIPEVGFDHLGEVVVKRLQQIENFLTPLSSTR